MAARKGGDCATTKWVKRKNADIPMGRLRQGPRREEGIWGIKRRRMTLREIRVLAKVTDQKGPTEKRRKELLLAKLRRRKDGKKEIQRTAIGKGKVEASETNDVRVGHK